MMAAEDDDEIPKLSAYTLAALQEFYDEQATKSKKSNNIVSENWQLSQFWYDDNTATVLAEECVREVRNGSIACISCPTLYSKLLQYGHTWDHDRAVLLEYDERFFMFGDDYIYYDYKDPLKIPDSIQRLSFDLVVADPPFLSEECLTKVAQTIKLLNSPKILLCTGSVMKDLAYELLQVTECSFTPKHKNNLANSFSCFTNYDSTLK